MKNILKISYGLVIAVLIAVISITACEKNEDDNVVLDAFGPSPILRGDSLTFVGKNLTLVMAINIKGCDPILPAASSNSRVLSNSKIVIQVPQTAEPCYVTLSTPMGEITTKTMLDFLEPISISEMVPLSVKAGDVLTINGDYLNNIKEVIFKDNVAVDKFESQTRYQIKVKVPKSSQTGLITLSTGGDNAVYVDSDDKLTVAGPALTGITPSTIKAGAELTLKGTDLDLVSAVVFPDDIKVSDFSLEDENTIKVTVPSNSKDGYMGVVSSAGITITASVEAAEITMAVPIVSLIDPVNVKAGDVIAVKGSDLDLVTSLNVPGVEDDLTIISQSATLLSFELPALASDGAITLHTAAGKEVKTPEYVTIKPVITGFDSDEVMATENVTIKGTNLKLVTSVIFNGGVSSDVVPADDGYITLVVPADAVTGKVKVKMANGYEAESPGELTITSANVPVVTTMPDAAKIGATITFIGTKLNLVESVVFSNDVKAISYGDRTAEKLEVVIPEGAVSGIVKLVCFDGQVVETPSYKIMSRDPIEDPSLLINDYEAHGGHDGNWDLGWNGNTELITESDGNHYLRVTDNLPGSSWVINCNHQADGALCPSIDDASKYVIKLDVKIENDFVPSATMTCSIVLGDSWNGWVENYLPLSDDGKVSSGGVWVTMTYDLNAIGYTGALDLSSGTNGLFNQGGTLPAGVCFDNLRFELKK